jgi:aminoglycoside 6'-N-acetyltransferase
MTSAYDFIPLTEAHRAPLLRWLAEPHVAEWWNDDETPEQRFVRYLSEPNVERFIWRVDGRDAGLIQTYCATDYPPPVGIAWNATTWRIDLFLGLPSLLGRGHGIGMLRAFIDLLWRRGAARVLIDPDPLNARAIHVYQRAGFCQVGVFTDSDGPALFMELDRPKDK